MATLQQPYRPEDDEQPQTPGGGLITGATASGGGQPTQAKPTSSGVFQNIGTYLKGAEGKSAALSGQIAGHIEDPANLARTGANEATGTIRDDIAKIPDRTGLTRRIMQDPASLSQEDIGLWKKFASGTYEGPTITDQYAKPLAYGTEAETRGKAAGKRGGYEGFEQQVIQRPMSPFERSLDVHGAKYYAPQPMQRAAKFATETPAYVTSQRDTAQGLIDTSIQTAKDQGAQATKDVLDYANKWRTDLGTRETEAETAAQTRIDDANKNWDYTRQHPEVVSQLDPDNPPDWAVLMFGDRAADVIRAMQSANVPNPRDVGGKRKNYLGLTGGGALPPGLYDYYTAPQADPYKTLGGFLDPTVAIAPGNVITADDVADAIALQELLDTTGIDLSGIAGTTPTGEADLPNVSDDAITNMIRNLGLATKANTKDAAAEVAGQMREIDTAIEWYNNALGDIPYDANGNPLSVTPWVLEYDAKRRGLIYDRARLTGGDPGNYARGLLRTIGTGTPVV